ncbi:MAG: GTP-binding protein [Alphaproteobacteria bacterium GM7ARS4]|nr:GTP-binding protein [Alphaproteobacteria bacterium GM7ARS4]
MEKRSVTVISGFLGAGKTSIIRHWLQTSPEPFALLINEFGACDVDGEILRSSQKTNGRDAYPIITLDNGCLCCTVAQDFLPAMATLAGMAHAPHHIVIETSGLSLPQPLIDAFYWEAIRSRFVMNGFITVIDAPAYQRGSFADNPQQVEEQRNAIGSRHATPIETLMQDQCDAADMVLINKADLLTMQEYTPLEAMVRERLGRDLPIIRCCHARCPWHVALGERHAMRTQHTISPKDAHAHGDHHDHDHDAFRSIVCSLPVMASEDQALTHARDVLCRSDVYRVKGFMAVEAKARRLVVQGVGDRLEHYYDRPWREDEDRLSSLVVIGGRSLSESLCGGG